MMKLLLYKFWRANQVKRSLCIAVPPSSPKFADKLPHNWDDYDWIVATNTFFAIVFVPAEQVSIHRPDGVGFPRTILQMLQYAQ